MSKPKQVTVKYINCYTGNGPWQVFKESGEEVRMSLFLRDLIRVRKAEEEVKPELSLDIGVELIKGTRRGDDIPGRGNSP